MFLHEVKKMSFFRCVYYTFFFPATPSAASRKPDDPTHTVGAQQERVFVTISHFWSLYIRRHHNNNCMRSARKKLTMTPAPHHQHFTTCLFADHFTISYHDARPNNYETKKKIPFNEFKLIEIDFAI